MNNESEQLRDRLNTAERIIYSIILQNGGRLSVDTHAILEQGPYNYTTSIDNEKASGIILEVPKSRPVHGVTGELPPIKFSQAPSGAMREKLSVTYEHVPFLEIAEVYTPIAAYGAQKYDDWNWSKGLPRSQIVASLLRHAFAANRGEKNDEESGLPHIGHLLWNAVALAHHFYHGIEDDIEGEPSRSYK